MATKKTSKKSSKKASKAASVDRRTRPSADEYKKQLGEVGSFMKTKRTAADVAAKFDVSNATAYKWIKDLRDAGFEVEETECERVPGTKGPAPKAFTAIKKS